MDVALFKSIFDEQRELHCLKYQFFVIYCLQYIKYSIHGKDCLSCVDFELMPMIHSGKQANMFLLMFLAKDIKHFIRSGCAISV